MILYSCFIQSSVITNKATFKERVVLKRMGNHKLMCSDLFVLCVQIHCSYDVRQENISIKMSFAA